MQLTMPRTEERSEGHIAGRAWYAAWLGMAALLLVLAAPATAQSPDTTIVNRASVLYEAENGFRGTASADATVLVRRSSTPVSLSLTKSADRADAASGDTILYTLSYGNNGNGVAAEVAIGDLLPLGTRYVAGSLRLNNRTLTDAEDGDEGSVQRAGDGQDQIVVRLGTLAAAATGTVTFRAVVVTDVPAVLTNTAQLTVGGTVASSSTAQTRVSVPELRVSKERLGAELVAHGEEVTYRIGWSNASATAAVHNAVLADTLPSALVFVSAEGSPQVAGQEIRWQLGTLAPGQSGSLLLVTRVAAQAAGEVVNRAVLSGSNAQPVAATAAAVRVSAAQTEKIEIAKRAGVLEARLGDAIPYLITVRNASQTPLADIIIHDELPEGVRFLPNRLAGADSAHVDGRLLRIWIAGPLAPGQEREVRYNVTLVAPGAAATLENRATAQTLDGRVRSDTVSAWVRLQGGHAMQTRTVIGKVWLDANNNGRQDVGEPGVAGVEVWSEDGQVVVTDREGRYSFRNLRPGTHVMRLDTLGLPAYQGLDRADNMMRRVRVDGWTTPRVDFRIVPRAQLTQLASADVEVLGAVLGDPAAAELVRPDSAVIAAPTVAPLRSAEDREAEEASTFLMGPVVRFVNPVDGTVVGTNRLYVGVQGEPGARVRLYNGDTLIGEENLRPDGRMDFIGVELAVGPQHLRVAMQNSWSNEVWDSVVVHRAGEITGFESVDAAAATLRAESQAVQVLRLRATDEWGVAVPGGIVTLEADGARIVGTDVDRSSVGVQLAVGADGILEVPLRAGLQVGPGEVRLSTGKTAGRIPLRVLPTTRSMIAVGTAQIGIGAAPESFGAVTLRGAIGAETSVSVSYDSRRKNPLDDFFGRGYDPLDESRYPTHGDGSEHRVLSGATQVLSARIEQGYNWLELGDIDTGAFGGDGRLATYRRAITGVGGRVATGPVTWRAFGSFTDQVLSQLQIRGDGTSGPYRFGGSIRPGTERLAVEVRSAENAALVIAREELHRFTDYQIDYLTGEVLLHRPIPAVDPSGNPLFVVAMLERRTGAESRLLGGVRMDLDAGRFIGLPAADSLQLFVLGVHDAGEASVGTLGHDVLGAGMRLRRGGLHAGGELLRAQTDTTAFAARASLGWALLDQRVRLGAEWTRIGGGFDPTTDPRLSSGLQDIRISGDLRIAEGSRLGLTHTRQRFDAFGAERQNTMLRSEQQAFGRTITSEGGLSADILGSGLTRSSSPFLTGKVRMPVSDRSALWLEGAHALAVDPAAPAGQVRPDQIGVGMSYRITRTTQVEAMQRWVGMGSDSAGYTLTSMKLRTESVFGGPFWGGLEHAAATNSSNSAVLGWSPRLRLSGGWSVDGMLERRFGLDRAPLLDPMRALPFAQPERDRWSAGAGTQWLPADSIARFTLRGELHNGELSRGHRLEAAGEAPAGYTAAFLTRHDWWKDERFTGVGMETSRRDRSLVGLALRPADSDALNLLGKLEWRRSINPGFGSRFSGTGEDQRLIGAFDAIWGPRPGSELAGRYATRLMLAGNPLIDTDSASVRALTHYIGGRAEQDVYGPLRTRVDARVLVDGSGFYRWNMAPSLLVTLGGQIEVEGGYRFGDLRDLDFATQGGNGFYATLGLRFSERSLGGVAGFWRERIATER